MKYLLRVIALMLGIVMLISCGPHEMEVADTPVEDGIPTSIALKHFLSPGDTLAGMVLTTAAGQSAAKPQLWDYCDFDIPDEDGAVEVRECELPLVQQIFVGHGLRAHGGEDLDELWDEWVWEMELDGEVFDLPAFGTIDVWGGTYRFWNVLLRNPEAGEHTLTYRIQNSVDSTKSREVTWIWTMAAPLETEQAVVADVIESEPNWWDAAVFYQIFVRSFYDSDGDGIGDFNGILEKLDYLNDGDPQTTTDLGVDAIWLMPIHPSPSYHGYDVTDYYDVNPQYGSLNDFRALLEAMHAHGIRVIIDLVMNHTSSVHSWFQESAADPAGERRDWYIWVEEAPEYRGPWGQVVWHRAAGGYYYGLFWGGMPDLNYLNPAVRDEMTAVAQFWLQDVGVDGFRLDAARHMIEEGEVQESTAATHAWWRDFRAAYQEMNASALTVGEIWASNYAVVDYVQGDELDMAFNFDLADAIVNGVNTGNAAVIRSALDVSQRLFEPGQVGIFLANHDMNRVMNQLGLDADQARLAASVLLTIPGTPFLYYGEEIGMQGHKPDELIRTPMQWSADPQAGFTSASAWEAVNADYVDVNVAIQSGDETSLLNHYRQLLQLRHQQSALHGGHYRAIESENAALLAFQRGTGSDAVLVLINLGSSSVSLKQLSLPQEWAGAGQLRVVYADSPVGDDPGQGVILSLADVPALPGMSTVILAVAAP